MGRSSRYEIEKFANNTFTVALGRIIGTYVEKKNRLTRQARLTGNTGAYLPALVNWGERLHEEVLALADAYANSFTCHGVPTEEMGAGQSPKDCPAYGRGRRGDPKLHSVTLRIPEEARGRS